MLTALYPDVRNPKQQQQIAAPDVRNPKQQQQIAAVAYFCCGQFA